MPLPVVGDDPVGRLEDVSRGPVVLFEADYPCAGVDLVEVEDVFNIGSTPPVNGLVIIPNTAKIVRSLRQKAEPQVAKAD